MKTTDIRVYDAGVMALTLAIIAATFLVDLYVPLGRTFWLSYFLAMVLSYASRRIWLPGMVAVLSIILLSIGARYGTQDFDHSIAILNRTLGSLVLVILAIAGTFVVRSRLRLGGIDWEQKALTRLTDALQGNPDAEEIAQQSLEAIGDETGARAGIFHVLRREKLEPLGHWGGASAENREEAHGHLWRAVREQRLIGLSAPGEAALSWGSGLLRGRTAHTVIVPLREGDRIEGLAEFGFDTEPSPRILSFLEQAGAKLGLELRAAIYRDELRSLLEETRRQSEELRAHGEEMAATNAALEEQTNALQLSEARLREQQTELEEQNALLEQQTAQMEEQRDAIAASRRQLADQAEELARESRYKSEFVANMSHELRTPLNALLIMARLLSENRHGNLSEEQCQWAETIESSGKDLLNLINDILDIARIEAGKVEISFAPVQPEDIIRRMSRVFTPQAEERGLSFSGNAVPGLPEISTDAARVEQILRNFIANALKFTQKGSVTLSVAPEPGAGLVFSVRDTGIGIAPEQHAAVFEAFRQADGSISRRFGGTGLGLSISRDLAERLEGRITLDSAPGQGSVFRLHLPLVAGQAGSVSDPLPEAAALPVAPRAPQPVSVTSGPVAQPQGAFAAVPGISDDRDRLDEAQRRLLIVEDDVAFARLLLDLARELGFGAVVVNSADDAIRAAHQCNPHGIVLDLGLPDHSGMTVLDRLKRDPQKRHIPVHIVSAEDRTREALSQGAVSYLVKPVARDALVDALQSISQDRAQNLRKLLIVEDDPAQLAGLKALLGSDDVEVAGVSGAREAQEACRRETFDCIVLDLSLRDGSGFDLLEALSTDETASFPPVIVYTARSLTEREEQRLRRYSRSIIIKGARSPERLIDEVTLFLHQVVSDLPARQREMLVASLNRDSRLEGRRILIVEDDIRNIYALNGVLEPHGVRTGIARNGREALDFLARVEAGEEEPVDLVLMDVMMPEMDGLTATREIRRQERWRNLPILMLTAKAMADDQAQCLAAGANDYLAKPLDVDKLLSLTRVWMSR